MTPKIAERSVENAIECVFPGIAYPSTSASPATGT